ncbi:MAG: CopG family transcriptional regulator [Planctomycetota bacterium]|jgi:hypothetical protein
MKGVKESKVTLKIPRPLYNRLSVILEDSGFNSVTDFVVYVLRDIAASGGGGGEREQLSDPEIRAIKNRLRNLGYL